MIEKEFTNTINYAVIIYNSLDNKDINDREKTLVSLYLSIVKICEKVKTIFEKSGYKIKNYNIKELKKMNVDECYNCFEKIFYKYIKENGIEQNPTCFKLMQTLLNEDIIKKINEENGLDQSLLENYFVEKKQKTLKRNL